MFLLIICVLAVVAYGIYRTIVVHREILPVAGFLRTELKEIRSLTEGREHTTLAYD